MSSTVIIDDYKNWGPHIHEDLKYQLMDHLEPRGEWSEDLEAEIDGLGDGAVEFMEACLNLLEGKYTDD